MCVTTETRPMSELFQKSRLIVTWFSLLVALAIGLHGANAPSEPPPVYAQLGPEQLILRGGGWPYLFHSREGTTVAFGHRHWVPGKPEPVVFTTRSFDQLQTWQEWQPGPEHGAGPVTEGSAVQLDDGRILIFDVYAYHAGNHVFHGKRWVSRDGWKTVSESEPTRVTVPGVKVDRAVDDRGDAVSRLYIRRSVIVLPGGDLLATGYGQFEGEEAPVEYRPAMKQHRSYLIRSRDEGRTWNFAGTIAMPPIGQEGPGEPVLVRLRHGPQVGRLICQLRVGREHAIYQTESDDEGVSWTKPHALRWTYSRFGRQRDLTGVDPDLIEMSDGTLVMGYGHKPDFMDNGNFLAFSRDHGATWESETRLNSTMTVGYVGVREISPGNLFVVYTRSDEPDAFKYAEARFDTVGRTVVVRRK